VGYAPELLVIVAEFETRGDQVDHVVRRFAYAYDRSKEPDPMTSPDQVIYHAQSDNRFAAAGLGARNIYTLCHFVCLAFLRLCCNPDRMGS
jgi:hypothetical protein